MQDINRIYTNNIGISFQWGKDLEEGITNRFQVIFRDMGFHLSLEDLKDFSDFVVDAKMRTNCTCCNKAKTCRSILLQTPSHKVDLAVNKEELKGIEDLIRGTIFQIELTDYLKNVCGN
ncbi:MAG: hypothetical protein HRT68_16895 [Flavobacteriaceae bacterium]|nr:hypothetical protein [Flavobacteriaceae bacterium]